MMMTDDPKIEYTEIEATCKNHFVCNRLFWCESECWLKNLKGAGGWGEPGGLTIHVLPTRAKPSQKPSSRCLAEANTILSWVGSIFMGPALGAL